MCTRPPLKVGLQCASSDDSDQAPDNMTGAGWTVDQINMRPFAQFRNSVSWFISKPPEDTFPDFPAAAAASRVGSGTNSQVAADGLWFMGDVGWRALSAATTVTRTTGRSRDHGNSGSSDAAVRGPVMLQGWHLWCCSEGTGDPDEARVLLSAGLIDKFVSLLITAAPEWRIHFFQLKAHQSWPKL